MLQQTRDYIIQLSDSELTQYILDGTSMYEPDAVAFAQQQFELRGLDRELISPSEVQANQSVHAQEEAARVVEAGERPLSLAGTAYYFLSGVCCAFPVVLLGWWWMKSRGEHTKRKQMLTIAATGFGLMLAIIVTMSLLGTIQWR